MRRAKGIGLLSGGLDSAIACKVLMEAGADVECLHFFTGFCVTGHNSRVGRKDRPIANNALQVAAEIGVPVDLVDISEEYLPVVLHPKFGYGKYMNPCIDCRVFMLRRAKAQMENVGADFVFTGEVVGQRPKSQRRITLDAIEREAGLEGRLLRPLSAGLLPPTIVEEEGLIDREKLLAIHGRGRKSQLELARKYELTAFMQPAGGCCFLTDQAYSNKFRDMLAHCDTDGLSLDEVFMLGVGRHFRLSPGLKVIIARDETENNFLASYRKDNSSAKAIGFAGPTAILIGSLEERHFPTIAALVARYSAGKQEPAVDVEFTLGGEVKIVNAAPAPEEILEKHRV